MRYSAVLFDLDGTLLDTLEDLADSVNTVLSHFGFPKQGLEAYKYWIGPGFEELIRRAIPAGYRNGATVAECTAAARREYSKRWTQKTRPYPGIPELLDALTNRGVRIAILSNKPDDFTKVIVAELLPHWHFELIIGARHSVPKKPNPTVALEIAERLEIPPCEFLYLGDSGTDMETARSAGMYPVGVLWGFRTATELKACGAKMLIENPSDLLDALE